MYIVIEEEEEEEGFFMKVYKTYCYLLTENTGLIVLQSVTKVKALFHILINFSIVGPPTPEIHKLEMGGVRLYLHTYCY